MQPRPTYYTDDITLMPLGTIWRMLRQASGVSRVLVFFYFVLRKVLRSRLPANYAAARPDVLPRIAIDAVPQDVVTELTPYVAACQAAGFSVVTWTRPDIIGNKQSYSVVMLHESGLVSALAVWFRISLGDEVQVRTIFGCHSFNQSGVQFSTGPVADRDWISELIIPDQELMRLPEETTANDAIKAHFDRVASRDDLVRFDATTLERQLLRTAQAVYDYMITKRFYVPITSREYERLSASSDIVTAELA